MSCCSGFCSGLVTLVTDALEQQLQIDQCSRPETPSFQGEAILTFKAKCDSAGSFIVLPSKVQGKRPDSPVVPVQIFVESYKNESDFVVQIEPSLHCSEIGGEFEARTAEQPGALIFDTTERLATAKRYGLCRGDTENTLQNSLSRYNGEKSEFYVDDTQSIAKFVRDKNLPYSIISSSSSGFSGSSQLIVYKLDQDVLETSVRCLSIASEAIQVVELDKLALVFNLFGEEESEGEFECKIRVVFVSTW